MRYGTYRVRLNPFLFLCELCAPASLREKKRLIFLLLILIIFSSCATVPPKAVPTPEELIPQWQPFAQDTIGGLYYFSGHTTQPRMEFHALRVDLFEPNLRITVGGDALSIKVSSFVRRNNLLAGINALPFDPVSAIEGEPRTNVGIVINDGVQLSPPHRLYDALVFYTDSTANTVAAIVSQQQLQQSIENIAYAVGGFYQILAGGEVNDYAKSQAARHPRSAAGVSADGRYLYLLVIDGRRLGSVGSTLQETAIILKQLGAENGINLDGGGSSALALQSPDGEIRVVNTPIHGNMPGRERAVAGCLGFGVKDQD